MGKIWTEEIDPWRKLQLMAEESLDEHFEVLPFSSGIKHGMGLNILSASIMDVNHFNTENILISTGRR